MSLSSVSVSDVSVSEPSVFSTINLTPGFKLQSIKFPTTHSAQEHMCYFVWIEPSGKWEVKDHMK